MLRARALALTSRFDRTPDRHVIAAGLTLFALLVAASFDPTSTPDTERFFAQADSIAAGHGFRTGGRLETFLPPGYPVFLAGFRRLSSEPVSLAIAHAVLVAGAAVLLFLALRDRGKLLASAGMLLVAANPWIARQTSYLLSESIGIFLCGIMTWLLARQATVTSTTRMFALGAVLIALPLTSPATLVLCGVAALVTLVQNRRSSAVPFVLAGMLLPWGLWQGHCLAAGVGIQPFLIRASSLGDQSSHSRWVTTWLIRPRELEARFHPTDLRSLPARAFRSEREREALQQLIAQAGSPTLSAAASGFLGELAAQRTRARPFYTRVFLPAARSVALWFDMPQLSHLQMEYVGRLLPATILADAREVGPVRATQRLLKALASTAAWFYWCAYPLLFLWLAVRGVMERDILAGAVAVSILAYTLVSGYFGYHESRRNFVFFPAAALLLRGTRLSRALATAVDPGKLDSAISSGVVEGTMDQRRPPRGGLARGG